MARRRLRLGPALLAGVLTGTLAAPALAQERLTAVILRGASPRPGGTAAAPSALVPGVRVESPPGSWTELAFSDGSSIVLEAGADFTLQGIGRDAASGRLMVRGCAGRGRLRISASDRVAIAVCTVGATVQVVGGSAVLLAGQGGSVTLLDGGRVVVARAGREDVIRRPGFSLLFDDGLQRRSRGELAALVDPFAPVAAGGGQATAAAVEVAEAPQPAADPRAVRQQASLTGLTANQGSTIARPIASRLPPEAVPVTPPGAPAPPVARRSSGALALALAGPVGGSTPGSGFSAPGPNSGTSSLNGTNAFRVVNGALVGSPDVFITDLGQAAGDPTNGLTQFSTGRVRRFTPGASGAAASRSDTGVVSLNGVAAPVSASNLYQNLTASRLPASGGPPLYDAVANVGVVTLVTMQSAVDNGGGRIDFQPGSLPLLSVSDVATPTLQFAATGTRASNILTIDRQYTGSAVLENALAPNTPTDGSVAPLQGENSLIVVRAAAPLPSPSRIDPNSAGGCIALGNCRPFPAAGDSVQAAIAQFPPTDLPSFATVNLTIGAPSRTAVATGVFIIDKITQASDAITAQRDIQPGERYFVIGGTPAAPTAQGLPGLAAGGTTRYAVSDGLDPARAGQPRGFVAGQTVESQFIAPGNGSQPLAFNQFNAFRPEETFVPGAARGDTHLLVTADPQGRAAGQAPRNPAMRADLQVTADGRSSAAVSAGGIVALPAGQQGRTAAALALSGQTVGSTQLDTGRAAVLIQSNLGSLGTDASGTGAHLLGESDRAPGQAGYFAVSQADTRQGAPGTAAGAQPGALQGVGQAAADAFAYTRLATNVGATADRPGGIDLQGFATAVVQSARGGQVSLYAVSSAQHGDAVISNAGTASQAEISAAFRLSPTAVGELASDPAAALAPASAGGERSVTFGGSTGDTPRSAAPSPTTFAALGSGRAMASVNAELRAGIAGVDGNVIAHPATGAPLPADLPASSPHLAWGYFLGDVAAQANGGSDRDHVPLGFWVAGRPVSLEGLRTLTGTATYSGGMIGTAADAASARSVVGQFAHQWDFARRTGSMNARLDGAAWGGVATSMPAGSAIFAGTSGAAAVPGRGDLTLSVQGGFFHDPATGGPLTGGNLPQAMGGQFAVRSAQGLYGANGILVGTRR